MSYAESHMKHNSHDSDSTIYIFTKAFRKISFLVEELMNFVKIIEGSTFLATPSFMDELLHDMGLMP